MKAKKVAVFVFAVVMGTAMLTSCGSKTVDADAVVAEMDDEVVRLGVANFMARYTQSTYDSAYVSYFGEEYWSQDMSGEGKTMEADVKKQILDNLKTYYALESHMDEYGVEITKKEMEKINKAAKTFIKDNEKDTIKLMSATERDVAEYLRLITIQHKMQKKIEADVDTKVSDEEAAQRTFSYVRISTAGTTDENGENREYSEKELKSLKAKAQILADGGAENFEKTAEAEGFQVEDFSYKAGSEDEEMAKAVLEEADKLKEGENSGVVEAEDAYYVIRLDSEFDKKATNEKKEEIVEERKSELYKKVCDDFKKDFKFEVDKNVWKSVTFKELFELKAEEDAAQEKTDDGETEEDTEKIEEKEES